MAAVTSLPAAFTSGQILTATNMNDMRGAFRVLQVVQQKTTTTTSTTSATYADSAFTLAITPSSTSSQVFVMFNATAYSNAASTDLGLRLVRASTTLRTNIGYCFSTGGSQSGDPNFAYLDSPATTSATTYKVQIARASGAGTVFLNPNSNEGYFTLMEISA